MPPNGSRQRRPSIFFAPAYCLPVVLAPNQLGRGSLASLAKKRIVSMSELVRRRVCPAEDRTGDRSADGTLFI